ncbi:MAG: aminoacyl-tRNA hydrolase [Chlamydiae bacterium]|nr:aminoacyl-tRNA hydrolase [Chlamydiota bacterium]
MNHKEEHSFYLLVGLGNPGSAYHYTRHNIGFHVLEHWAKKNGWSFKLVNSLQGKVAQGVYEGKKVILLLPMTYMNSSGESVRLVLDYFKVQLSHLMVISDDIAIPFSSLRVKPSGSSGGHNGLKSIESHLSTQIYPRMRVGVGDRTRGRLADFVLSRFSEEEMEHMLPLLSRAESALEVWIKDGIVKAMQVANGRQEEKKPEQNVGE